MCDLNKTPDIDSDTDSDTDSDKYIDYSKLSSTDDTRYSIYQFVINQDKLSINNIGISSEIYDIIIQENFGPEKNLNLYSCVYESSELINRKEFYPVLRLERMSTDNHDVLETLNLGVTIDCDKSLVDHNIFESNEWSICWVKMFGPDDVHIYQSAKDIDPNNIIEKIIDCDIQLRLINGHTD